MEPLQRTAHRNFDFERRQFSRIEVVSKTCILIKYSHYFKLVKLTKNAVKFTNNLHKISLC